MVLAVWTHHRTQGDTEQPRRLLLDAVWEFGNFPRYCFIFLRLARVRLHGTSACERRRLQDDKTRFARGTDQWVRPYTSYASWPIWQIRPTT